jgi:hypothetical protein
MPEKRFIWVRDKSTRHQYDVLRSKFDPDRHERVARVPDSHTARRPKIYVPKKGVTKPVADGSSNTIETVGQTLGANHE